MRLPACLFVLLVLMRLAGAGEPAFLDERMSESPRVLQGELPNGLRYAVMRQPYPEGSISLRLLIKAGSMHEEDDERGYAHFVEHMAFNGTRNYPAGELVRSLQREGIGFGAHFGANTSVIRTVYKLDLPNTQPALFERALTAFDDFAQGLLFQKKEVEKERGVILSEDLTRRSDEREEGLFRNAFVLRGTLPASRDPIGTAESVKKASPERLKQFYDAWYRPELMTVIVVGDIDSDAVVATLRSRFSGLQARAPARKQPEMGALASGTGPEAAVFFRGGKGLQLSVYKVEPREIVPSEQRTWRRLRSRLCRDLANSMLQGRLSRLTLKEGRVLSASGANFDYWFNRFAVQSLAVNGTPDKFRQVLSIGEQELRRALEFGFDPSELELTRERWKIGLKEMAQASATQTSQQMAASLLDSLADLQSLVRFTDEDLEKTLAVLDSIEVKDCQEAFVKSWEGAKPLIFASVPQGAAISGKGLTEAWLESRKVPVTPAAAIRQIAFAYEDFGAPADVIEKRHDSSLDFWTVLLSNGIRINIKRTVFEPQELRMSLRIGLGRVLEPKEQPGIGLWAGEWMLGGLGRHTPEELALLQPTGKLVLNASADTDALTLAGHASSSNLKRLLSTVTAQITDSAFRKDAHEKMGAHLNSYINPLLRSSGIVMQARFIPFLAGGDARLGLPLHLDAKQEEVKQWVLSQLSRGRIELSFVGDLDVDACIAAVASTLGTLPKRDAFVEPEGLRSLNFPKAPQTIQATFKTPQEGPVTLFFAWPVREALDAERLWRLRMLGSVLESRIHEQLREDRGGSYATSAGLWTFGDAYPGMAYLRCEVQVQAKLRKKLAAETLRIAEALREMGPTEDELLRAKAQFLAKLKADLSTNTYWVKEVLDGSHEKPWRLDVTRGAEHIIQETTRDSLHALAQRYLGEKSCFRCDATPVKK